MSDIVEVNSTDVVTIDGENVEIITIAPGDTTAFLVEEDGSTIVSNSSGINFKTNMDVSDDGDGTVTVSWDNVLPAVDSAWLNFDASTGDWKWIQSADAMVLRWNPDGVGSNTTVWNVDPGTTTITWSDYAHDFNSNNVSNIGTLDVDGAASLNSTLAVTSTSTFTGATTHNGGITLGGAVTGAGNAINNAGSIDFGQSELDYYEEVTWTPVLKGSTTVGTNSYTNQAGWAEVGPQVVNVYGRLTLDGTAGALDSTGTLILDGLPSPVNASVNFIGGGLIPFARGISLASGTVMSITGQNGTSELILRRVSNTTTNVVSDSQATDSLDLIFFCSYRRT